MIELESDWAKALGVRPSVSAVILRERRLLLQKRSDGGQWGLPGGSVEVGESVLQALSREVRARRLPATLLPNHRIRVRDALLRRRRPLIR